MRKAGPVSWDACGRRLGPAFRHGGHLRMESEARTEVKTVVLDVIEVDQTINTTQFLGARDWIAEQIQKAIGGTGSACCTRQRNSKDSCS